MPTVMAYRCSYDPRGLAGLPIGMFHCPACGCMVLAGLEHGPCFVALCPAAQEARHPGAQVEVEVQEGDAEWLAEP
jgi:hypothetical protein